MAGEERRSYEELLHDEQRFRMLADRARDIVARYRILPEPALEYMSPSVERVTGYPVQSFYDDPHMHVRLIHPDDRARLALLIQRTPEEMAIPITLRWVRKDGETVWIEQSLVPELDEQGRVVAMESISRDVTDQVRLEIDLRRAQKLDAVGRLAGGIAHDFNNLLGVTLLCGEQLKRAIGQNPTLIQWVDMILDSSRRGAELAQQLLAFARKEALRDTPSDAHLVLRALHPMLQRLLPEDVRLELDLSARDALIALGQSQLEQVLVNLVVNARDAMPQGGLIAIRTLNRPTVNQSAVRSTPSEVAPRGLMLEIKDTGVGMTEPVLDRIFEPFFTTKAPNEGSGLGLSVVYGIVTQSGGHIAVRSKPGAGTVVTLVWPCSDGSTEALTEPSSLEPLRGGNETVLLVEDAPLLRRLEADMLERLGYRVLSAGSAAEAETRFAQSAVDGHPVDLLLTDVGLPDNSGVALAKTLCARRPGLRVVYTSGHTTEEMTRHGVTQDQLAIVAKPFTEAELASVVRAALDKSS